MKRHNLILILLMLCCGNMFAQSGFRFRRQIISVEKEAWYSIPFAPDMFQHLGRDMADIRVHSITEGDTLEIPYLLRTEEDQVQRESVELKLFNRSTRGGIMYLTFEMHPSRRVNILELEFDESNYLGHVTVEGSDDRSTWFEVLKNYRIVSIDKDNEVIKFTTVRFPASSYRYLRLGISSDVGLHFRGASFGYNKIKPGTYHDVPLSWKVTRNRKLKQSTVVIRLEDYAPVSMINVGVSNDGDFYRGFELMYVRDSIHTEKGWIKNYEGILDGHLTSFQANEFKFRSILTNELRLIVRDYDNLPLEIGQVSGAGPEINIVTFLKPGNNFLLYGSKDTEKPIYDLTHFQSKIPESTEIAALAPSEEMVSADRGENPLFQDKIWLWSIMGVVIVGLGLFTMKMMRQK